MKRWLFILLAVIVVSSAHADYAAYGGSHTVTATRGSLTFRHVHNWDSPKLKPLFSNLTHHERFFSAANDFAFVELRDGSKILFRSPSPALTHLWISPDGQFFVGLSDIMLRNSSNFCGQTTWQTIPRAASCRCSVKPNPHAS
jgi:hypothetical protein